MEECLEQEEVGQVVWVAAVAGALASEEAHPPGRMWAGAEGDYPGVDIFLVVRQI